MAGLEGTKLGSYEIVQKIGSGGMAEVYRAKQLTAFGREVAIKVVRAGYSEDPNFRERFLREAQAISKLSHPNILPLIEFGEQEEMLYLVMPLVREGTLRDLMHQRRGPLPLDEAITFFTQLCNAVHYAHTQGIIHRDIKPQNMLLQQGTHLLLADFGIARDTSESRMTTIGVGIGTVEYMAPEQALGQVDARGDIYALGIVLYQLLTGQVPFTGSTPFQTLQKHSTDPLPDARALNPALPSEAIDVLQTALAKDPKDRFQSAQALGRAAQQIRAHATSSPPSSATKVVPPLSNTPVPPVTPAGPVVSARPDQPSSPESVQGGGQSNPSMPAGPAFPTPTFPPPPSAVQGGTVPTQQPREFLSLPTIAGSNPQTTGDPASWSAWNSGPSRIGGQDAPLGPSGPQPPMPPGPAWNSGQPMGASGLQPPMLPGAAWNNGQPMVLNTPYVPRQVGAAVATGPQRSMSSTLPGTARTPRTTVVLDSFRRLSLPQRLLFGGLAALIVVGSLVAILLSIHHPATTTVSAPQIATASQTITKYGAVNAATVAGASGAPQAQITVGARLRTATPPSIPNHIDHLTVVPTAQEVALVSSPTAYPAGLAVPQPLNGFSGLGQAQLGTDTPMDSSVANNGTATIEVVDGAFVAANASAVKVISLAVFFQQLIGPATALGESRVFFDGALGKWILITNQLSMTKGGGVTASAFDLAISQTAAPIGKWDIYQFTTAASAYGGCNWADYPQLGVNAVGVFITATSFACGVGGKLYGASLWALSRQALSAGTITNLLVTTGFATAQGNPVVTLTPAVEGGNDDVEWLLSNDAGYVSGGQVSQQLAVWAVVGDLSGTKAFTLHSASLTLPQAYADPPAALQLGSDKPLNTGDARIAQAQMTHGHLYAAFTTAINWAGDPVTRAGVYWLDLQPTLTSASTPAHRKINVSVYQQGVVGDPGYYFYSPSFVADAFGNEVLLAVASGTSLDPHMIFISRAQSDPLGTLGGAHRQYFFLPLANTGPYTGSHWGDFGGAYAAPVLPDGKSQFLWVSGPHVDSNAGWETTIWQISTKKV